MKIIKLKLTTMDKNDRVIKERILNSGIEEEVIEDLVYLHNIKWKDEIAKILYEEIKESFIYIIKESM